MLQITKIFCFEMAHAVHGNPGACKNIHGHSYQLEVTIAADTNEIHYLPAPGFILDFKELKKMVVANIIDVFDHKLLLSTDFLQEFPALHSLENLVKWQVEPTAENLLIFMRCKLEENLPAEVNLVALKLYETKDSFAEWISEKK